MDELQKLVVGNLGLTVQYMEVKVVAASLMQALALSLGLPDAPLGLFLGGLGNFTPLSTFLPMDMDAAANTVGLSESEAVIMRLLLVGYENERNDLILKRAPLGAYMFAQMGQKGVKTCLNKIEEVKAGGNSATLLDCFPPTLVATIAQCAANVSKARAADLRRIANAKDPNVREVYNAHSTESVSVNSHHASSSYICGCFGFFGRVEKKNVQKFSPPSD